jgi:hypothetical protein
MVILMIRSEKWRIIDEIGKRAGSTAKVFGNLLIRHWPEPTLGEMLARLNYIINAIKEANKIRTSNVAERAADAPFDIGEIAGPEAKAFAKFYMRCSNTSRGYEMLYPLDELLTELKRLIDECGYDALLEDDYRRS